MKITFEGETIQDIFDQMQRVLLSSASAPAAVKPAPSPMVPAPKAMPDSVFEGPGPLARPAAKPVNKPVEKPERTEKQKANDERLRERAEAKKAAGLNPFNNKMLKAAAPPPKPVEPEKPVDPVEVVKIRQKTITDLQEAYANGHQQEVFELLSRFGNGAKSFRELPPEAFVPIRDAIDKGALT